MLLYRCPEGHRFGVAGYGEDLAGGIERPTTRGACPVCCPRVILSPDEAVPEPEAALKASLAAAARKE